MSVSVCVYMFIEIVSGTLYYHNSFMETHALRFTCKNPLWWQAGGHFFFQDFKKYSKLTSARLNYFVFHGSWWNTLCVSKCG